MAACGASDRAIKIAIVDCHLSEGVRDALLLGKNSFYNILMSVVNLRSYCSISKFLHTLYLLVYVV